VSRTLERGNWNNTTVLGGDLAEDVGALKRSEGGEIDVTGSGELVQGLLRHDLVDVFKLITLPIVLGTGKRLFGEGTVPARLRLVDSATTPAGVTFATYERAGAVETGSFRLD
jgi:dihydrofolate reductase